MLYHLWYSGVHKGILNRKNIISSTETYKENFTLFIPKQICNSKKEYLQIVAGMHNMIDMRAKDNVLFKCNNIFFGKTFGVFYL